MVEYMTPDVLYTTVSGTVSITYGFNVMRSNRKENPPNIPGQFYIDTGVFGDPLVSIYCLGKKSVKR